MDNISDVKLVSICMYKKKSNYRTEHIFMQIMVQIKTARIVYVSCNPETQARDMENLVEKIQQVDLFLNTGHVETVVLLVKEYAHDDELVSIKVDLEGISLDQEDSYRMRSRHMAISRNGSSLNTASM